MKPLFFSLGTKIRKKRRKKIMNGGFKIDWVSVCPLLFPIPSNSNFLFNVNHFPCV